MSLEKVKPAGKIWLEYEGRPLLGKGGADILKAIKEEKSISMAARRLGMSYRYVWNYVDKINGVLKEPVVKAFRGGKHGGGGAVLTEIGEGLLKEYNFLERYINDLLMDEKYWEAVRFKNGTQNSLKGIVKDVEKGDAAASVRVEVRVPVVVTALVSRESVERLDINVGDEVEAVIKATEVMIAK